MTDTVPAHPSADMSGWVPKFLTVASVALFWLLPFSPIIAIAALAATYRSTGWERRAAVAGAILSTGFTIAIAILFLCLVSSIPRVE